MNEQTIWEGKSQTLTGAPADPAASDPIEQMHRLGELRDAGALSADEFTAKKEDLLSRM